MKLESQPSLFEEIFIPDYDELALYAMGLSCLLLLVTNSTPSNWKLSDITQVDDWFLISFFTLFFAVGMLLCIYHAFSDREKTLIEKKIMLFFAIFLNGSSGIFGGIYILTHKNILISPFPILNIISGSILISALRADIINEKNIKDENASFSQVVSTTIIVGLIFFISQYVMKLNWVLTYSICIAWATTFNNTTNALLIRHNTIINKV